MNYLLDTHTFIWSILDSNKLSLDSKKIITNKSNEIYVSIISFWEISLKVKMKKFSFKKLDIKELPGLAVKIGFNILTLQPNDAISYSDLSLKHNHKDPFDRMLIWQAIMRNFILISKDRLFKQYVKDGLKLVW